MRSGQALCGLLIFATACGESSMASDVADATDAVSDGFTPDTDVSTPTRWRSISVGSAVGCATSVEGAVYCWGYNFAADLWNGDRIVTTPRRIPGVVSSSTKVSFGGACALGATGSVTCWGDNTRGELGRGTVGTADGIRAMGPGNVALPPIREFSSQSRGICALMTVGEVRCWGDNAANQTGIPPSPCVMGTCSATPLMMPLAQSAVSVHSAAVGGCAVLMDGSLWCWGGDNGLLGIGDRMPPDCPEEPCFTRIPQRALISDVARVFDFGDSRCVLHRDGTVSCWGTGLLPIDLVQNQRARKFPTLVPMPARVTEIFGRVYFGCVRLEDRTTWCWGNDPFAEPVPGGRNNWELRRVPGLDRFVSVSSGVSTTCAVDAEGVAWCWGRSLLPIPGLGVDRWQSEPIRVGDPTE